MSEELKIGVPFIEHGKKWYPVNRYYDGIIYCPSLEYIGWGYPLRATTTIEVPVEKKELVEIFEDRSDAESYIKACKTRAGGNAK